MMTRASPSIKDKLPDLRDYIESVHAVLRRMLNDDAADVAAEIEEGGVMAAASDWAMYVLNLVVKRGGDEAAAFLSEERRLKETDPQRHATARDRFERMQRWGLPNTQRAQRQRCADLLARTSRWVWRRRRASRPSPG
jgi:hypothetical protein